MNGSEPAKSVSYKTNRFLVLVLYDWHEVLAIPAKMVRTTIRLACLAG